MNRSLLFAGLFLSVLPNFDARADVPLKGYFIDHEACNALQSIRKGTNPGDLKTEPGHFYPIIGKNKPAASHYMIQIEGANPDRRWVAVECGEHVVAADGSDGGGGGGGGGGGSGSGGGGGGDSGDQPAYVLAISWQPAFCEGKPDKTECKTETPDRFDATHFTLHGLWPQPMSNVYCNVPPELTLDDKNSSWEKLPAPNLSDATRDKLAQVMPGTQSKLERHEWIKHGTCFHAESADEYFSKAVALMDQLNSSKAQELFASHVGAEIDSKAIRDAFDESFGDGAGDRVRVSCKRDGGRNLIVEITVGLVGQIGDSPSLANLIAASSPTDPGCPRGIVDPVGRQ